MTTLSAIVIIIAASILAEGLHNCGVNIGGNINDGLCAIAKAIKESKKEE